MKNKQWWKESVIYQIYPRSFKDSNGDGVGDLNGIIDKLDYLKSLGIDVLWLGPCFKSPNDDNGYDISNYCKIMEEFGTMADFDKLLKGLHKRGIKLLLDLVVNHSSDEHDWFKEAKKSKDNPYRNFYYWKDGNKDGPPNNWLSFFGGSAWEYSPETDQYYLHLFTKKQPDLNWENPIVRNEIYNIIKFWLDKGVDGFRMDVISLISKRLDFKDSPKKDLNYMIDHIYANGPRIHEFIKEMNRKVLSKYDIMTVGEGPGISADIACDFVGKEAQELNMVFSLEHMFIDHGPKGRLDPVPFTLVQLKNLINKWDAAMGEDGWNTVFFDNHDFPRMISRFADDGEYRNQSAKMMAIIIATLRGTPSIYQGSEIGMTNVQFSKIADYRDVETFNFYKEHQAKGGSEASFLKKVYTQGRDNVRTPMQWSKSKNAGFTSGKPWIKVNPNFKTINVDDQLEQEHSVLSFYKKIIKLRKKHKTWIHGKYQELSINDPQVFIYERWSEDKHYLICCNFTSDQISVDLDIQGRKRKVVISNYDLKKRIPGELFLQPWEGTVYLLT